MDFVRPLKHLPRRFRRCAAILPIALFLVVANTADAQRTLYVTAQSPSSSLYTLTIDLNTGALTEVPSSKVSAGSTPAVPSISPDGKFIYAPDFFLDNLWGWSLDPTTGAPTVLPSFPAPTGSGPNAAIVNPSGNGLYVANYNDGTITSLALSPTGAVSPAAGSPNSAGSGPTTLALSPMTNNAYVPDSTVDNIGGFSYGGSPGVLNPLAGFPFAVDPGSAPIDAEYSPNGQFLFVLNQGSFDIATYAVDAGSGALTETGVRPSVGGSPAAIAASPNGRWLAVVSQGTDTLTMFEVDPTGQLVPIDVPVPLGGAAAYDVVFTPDSRYVYTSNYNSGNVSGFAIDQTTGIAAPVPGSPFDVFNGPPFSLAVSPDQGPTAAFSSSVDGYTASFDASASSDPDGSVASYDWNFGDGTSATTSTPNAGHVYPANGNYTTTLTVTDDENCSTTKIGTGQTINCNGSSAAQTSGVVNVNVVPPPVPPANPLILSKVSVTEQRLQRGQTRRRIVSRYTLNRKAGVTIQFQKINRGRFVNGRCRYESSSNRRFRKCAHVRNYGNPVKLRGNPGSNRKTFVRTFGGKSITRGRYRQVIYAADGTNTKSKTLYVGFRVQGT